MLAGSGLVCIGASAGGMRSLQHVMRGLPAGFAWPILVTQHFPADVASHLPEILGRAGSLPVREAVEKQAIEAGTVLTCPSGCALGVAADHRIALQPRRPGLPTTIDHMFTTASDVAGSNTIAVVLSGFGSDGAAGSREVKKQGGTVIAESPQTAEWSGMPSAAIGAAAATVLPSHEIGPQLARLASRASEL